MNKLNNPAQALAQAQAIEEERRAQEARLAAEDTVTAISKLVGAPQELGLPAMLKDAATNASLYGFNLKEAKTKIVNMAKPTAGAKDLADLSLDAQDDKRAETIASIEEHKRSLKDIKTLYLGEKGDAVEALSKLIKEGGVGEVGKVKEEIYAYFIQQKEVLGLPEGITPADMLAKLGQEEKKVAQAIEDMEASLTERLAIAQARKTAKAKTSAVKPGGEDEEFGFGYEVEAPDLVTAAATARDDKSRRAEEARNLGRLKSVKYGERARVDARTAPEKARRKTHPDLRAALDVRSDIAAEQEVKIAETKALQEQITAKEAEGQDVGKLKEQYLNSCKVLEGKGINLTEHGFGENREKYQKDHEAMLAAQAEKDVAGARASGSDTKQEVDALRKHGKGSVRRCSQDLEPESPAAAAAKSKDMSMRKAQERKDGELEKALLTAAEADQTARGRTASFKVTKFKKPPETAPQPAPATTKKRKERETQPVVQSAEMKSAATAAAQRAVAGMVKVSGKTTPAGQASASGHTDATKAKDLS